jgi:hypothetical protein
LPGATQSEVVTTPENLSFTLLSPTLQDSSGKLFTLLRGRTLFPDEPAEFLTRLDYDPLRFVVGMRLPVIPSKQLRDYETTFNRLCISNDGRWIAGSCFERGLNGKSWRIWRARIDLDKVNLVDKIAFQPLNLFNLPHRVFHVRDDGEVFFSTSNSFADCPKTFRLDPEDAGDLIWIWPSHLDGACPFFTLPRMLHNLDFLAVAQDILTIFVGCQVHFFRLCDNFAGGKRLNYLESRDPIFDTKLQDLLLLARTSDVDLLELLSLSGIQELSFGCSGRSRLRWDANKTKFWISSFPLEIQPLIECIVFRPQHSLLHRAAGVIASSGLRKDHLFQQLPSELCDLVLLFCSK